MRFAFSVIGGGYVRSRYGVLLARVEAGTRLFLSAGEHILALHDPSLMTRVSIVFHVGFENYYRMEPRDLAIARRVVRSTELLTEPRLSPHRS